jgi:hypothetical protein
MKRAYGFAGSWVWMLVLWVMTFALITLAIRFGF